MNSKGRISWKFLVVLAMVAALVPVAAIGWRSLYNDVLETISPEILVTEMPRGIGLAPVSIKISVSDTGSGLDEVIVRTRQKGVTKELLRRQMGGKKSAQFSIDFAGEKSDLEEGVAELSIKAFDRSFWNNAAEKIVPLAVDYRKPRIEVLSTQHNAVKGGTQLILYRAFDENLAVSGIKIGNHTFLGYPARGLDKAIEDPSIYAAIYAVDFEQDVDESSVRAFAEDQVGNVVSVTFPNRIQRRVTRNVSARLSEDWLRDKVATMADNNSRKFEELAESEGRAGVYESKRGGPDRLVEQFRYVNGVLRGLNRSDIASFVKTSRFEKLWEGPFVREPGSVVSAYADTLVFEFDGTPAGSMLQLGYEFGVTRDNGDVVAAAGGVVVFSETIGVYGRVVAIDHGLGVVTLYAHLDKVTVSKGQSVSQGEIIGQAGTSGLVATPRVYFETRIQNVPVDSREWWDKRWYYGHITAKVNELKRSLGLPVYQPLE